MTSSAPDDQPRAIDVAVSDEELIVTLHDGRRLATPLAWYPRLLEATPEQRRHFELLGGGVGIHWPALDEDLSVEGMLRGHVVSRRSDP